MFKKILLWKFKYTIPLWRKFGNDFFLFNFQIFVDIIQEIYSRKYYTLWDSSLNYCDDFEEFFHLCKISKFFRHFRKFYG